MSEDFTNIFEIAVEALNKCTEKMYTTIKLEELSETEQEFYISLKHECIRFLDISISVDSFHLRKDLEHEDRYK